MLCFSTPYKYIYFSYKPEQILNYLINSRFSLLLGNNQAEHLEINLYLRFKFKKGLLTIIFNKKTFPNVCSGHSNLSISSWI